MRNALAAFAGHAAADAARIALIDAEGALTYGALLQAVRGTAAALAGSSGAVGVLAPKNRQGVIWLLALAWAGRRAVPLPEFFSAEQWAHLAADAGLSAVLAPAEADAVAALGLRRLAPLADGPGLQEPVGGATWVIYTSGTTGRPKGVLLGEAQLDASIAALAEATAAQAGDRMLSVLPFALLLELVAGLALPLSVGASVVLCAEPRQMVRTAALHRPSATVLVPDLLAAWVAALEAGQAPRPEGLRFVAVGGAAVPRRLADRAWALGLPAYEGYGLSECCSVVAVNRPGARVAGTVGPPLPGLAVEIENGEIVVRGPTVMEGYLGGVPSGGCRRTGDAGHFDAEGNLVVEGRIDDVIVTSGGRNIHPEWIEAMLQEDPRLARCAVVTGGGHPRAVLVPARDGLLTAAEVEPLVARLTADAPDYARPRRSLLMSESDLLHRGLMTGGGRLRRRAIAAYLETL